MKERKFKEAVDRLKKADIVINGPLNTIEGLYQLRSNVFDATQQVLNAIIESLLEWLVSEPFDRQLLDVVRKLPESSVTESPVAQRLLGKYFPELINNVSQAQTQIGVELAKDHSKELALKIKDALDALMIFDQLETAVEQLNMRTPAICKQALSDTVGLLTTLYANEITDSSHLVNLINMVRGYYSFVILSNDSLLVVSQ